MNNDIRDALLSKCIDFFNNIRENAEPDERFGKKYERCYCYTVRNINGNILLTQEKLIWVSRT